MKILVACDLDNTILFSIKKSRNEDICIEKIKDKDQGFVTPYVYDNILKLNDVIFVPITTRSTEQYRRINWPNGFNPHMAITTNGAILLKDNINDLSWHNSINTIDLNVLNDLYEKLKDDEDFIRCRIVDESYLFVYCKNDDICDEKLNMIKSMTELNVVISGKKIYIFPDYVDKKSAVLKLKEIIKPDLLICAGDSDIDVGMLKEADLAIVPNEYMANLVNNKNMEINKFSGKRFPDFVLETIIKIIEERGE